MMAAGTAASKRRCAALVAPCGRRILPLRLRPLFLRAPLARAAPEQVGREQKETRGDTDREKRRAGACATRRLAAAGPADAK